MGVVQKVCDLKHQEHRHFTVKMVNKKEADELKALKGLIKGLKIQELHQLLVFAKKSTAGKKAELVVCYFCYNHSIPIHLINEFLNRISFYDQK